MNQMSIPNFQEFMLPMLEFFRDGQAHDTAEILEKLVAYFDISEDERKIRLPSGKSTVYKNRIDWARTYLHRAGLLERLDRGIYKITERGLEVLEKKPQKIDVDFLMQFREFKEFRRTRSKGSFQATDIQNIEQDQETPLELLDKTYQIIKEQLAKEILERILQKSPIFLRSLLLIFCKQWDMVVLLKMQEELPKKLLTKALTGL